MQNPDDRLDIMPHFTAVVLISVAGWLTFPLAYGSRGYWRITSIDGICAAAMLAVYFFARRMSRRADQVRAAHLCLAVALFGIVGAARLSGDGVSLSAWYVVALPLAAAYMAGWRAALGWGAICVVATIFLGAAPGLLPITPEVVLKDWEFTVGQLVMLGLIVGYAVSSRRLTEQQFITIRERERALEERNEQLARARDEAVRASEARSQFLANMSHEIRTPLNGVIGMATLLENTPLLDSQKELLRSISASGNLLLSVVNDILDFSRLDAGSMRIEETEVDLQEILDDVLELFGPQVAARDVDLAGWLERGVSRRVRTDPMRIRQILTNLVGNAVKFTHEGSIIVVVRREEDMLHFTVRDSGIGIAPEKLQQLFQPFVQGDASTTRQYGGSGLGLTITRRLAELMGGTVWVDSEPAAGSTFHVTVRAPDASGQPAEVGRLAGYRVLLLEPRHGSRTALEIMATGLGVQLTAVADLSALDAALAGLEGLDAVLVSGWGERTLQAVERVYTRWPSIPVGLLMPAGSMPGAAGSMPGEAIHAQAVGHRPLRLGRFASLLEALVNGRIETRRSVPNSDRGLAERRPLRILVVDDNVINQQVALLMLRQLGYAPDLAENGREAVEACANSEYDLVFMDMHMPVMDGLEATATIRAAGGRQPRIIALTASVLPADRHKFEAAGVDGFLGKPMELSALVATLENLSPPPSVPHTPIDPEDFDLHVVERLRALCARNPARFEEMLALYLRTTSDAIRALRHAVETRDSAALERPAHNLKSSAATFGAMRVSALAGQLDDGPDWDVAAALLDDLEAAHTVYSDSLRQSRT